MRRTTHCAERRAMSKGRPSFPKPTRIPPQATGFPKVRKSAPSPTRQIQRRPPLRSRPLLRASSAGGRGRVHCHVPTSLMSLRTWRHPCDEYTRCKMLEPDFWSDLMSNLCRSYVECVLNFCCKYVECISAPLAWRDEAELAKPLPWPLWFQFCCLG